MEFVVNPNNPEKTFIDPQSSNYHISLSLLKLACVAARLPSKTMGPGHDRLLNICKQLFVQDTVANTFLLEYKLAGMARMLAANQKLLSEMYYLIITFVSESANSALQCGFTVMYKLAKQALNFKDMRSIITYPVDWWNMEGHFKDYGPYLAACISPDAAYHFGTTEGQSEMAISVLMQLAPVLVALSDIGCVGANGKHRYELLIQRTSELLRQAGLSKNVAMLYGSSSVHFDPRHNQVDLACVSVFIGSLLFLVFALYGLYFYKPTVQNVK